MSKIAEALDAIAAFADDTDLSLLLTSLLKGATVEDATQQTFEAAFRLFERNPLANFGSPGPLVHWLERNFPKYVLQLEQSLRRRPTEHTLWMCNRILNAKIDTAQKNSLMTMLENVATRTDLEPRTVEAAGEWLAMHRN